MKLPVWKSPCLEFQTSRRGRSWRKIKTASANHSFPTTTTLDVGRWRHFRLACSGDRSWLRCRRPAGDRAAARRGSGGSIRVGAAVVEFGRQQWVGLRPCWGDPGPDPSSCPWCSGGRRRCGSEGTSCRWTTGCSGSIEGSCCQIPERLSITLALQ